MLCHSRLLFWGFSLLRFSSYAAFLVYILMFFHFFKILNSHFLLLPALPTYNSSTRLSYQGYEVTSSSQEASRPIDVQQQMNKPMHIHHFSVSISCIHLLLTNTSDSKVRFFCFFCFFHKKYLIAQCSFSSSCFGSPLSVAGVN